MTSRGEFLAVVAIGLVAARRREEVTIIQFSDAGVRLGPARVAKVVKSDAEWQRQLSPLAFEVARMVRGDLGDEERLRHASALASESTTKSTSSSLIAGKSGSERIRS